MDLLPIVIFTICLAIPSNSMETNIYTNTIQLQRGGKYIKVRLIKLDMKPCMHLPYARHYNPRFVYFLPTF